MKSDFATCGARRLWRTISCPASFEAKLRSVEEKRRQAPVMPRATLRVDVDDKELD